MNDYVGILYYRHGLFCASNPISCLLLVTAVLFLCCYPLRNLSSFSSSLEQYKQSTFAFDGLEANAEINQFIEYDRLADRPAWYNRVPIAYIQRILVKSVFIPSGVQQRQQKQQRFKVKQFQNSLLNNNDSNGGSSNDHNLYLVDAFRTPLAHLFELNDFLHRFRTLNSNSSEKKSLIDDLCVHVGETLSRRKHKPSESAANTDYKPHTHLPEFNCLYLSPTNFWSNDFSLFMKDEDIIQTLNNSPNYLNVNLGVEKSKQRPFDLARLLSFANRILFSSSSLLDEDASTDLSELLFGVSRDSVITALKDDEKLNRKLSKLTLSNKSIIFTYAITIALKNYDKVFIDELTQRLYAKFSHGIDSNINSSSSVAEEELKNTIFNLQYTSQSIVYYIPYLALYFLLFLYIYISVRKIEFVKSKWGLALAAVSQVVASLFMSIGICSYFGFTPTLNGGEIFPYLILFIGFENIVVLTKSVVSTPFDLDVRYRIALGLKKESWLITKILLFELIIIFFGICTMVPAIQEFCVFAYVGLLIDFFMQMIFFVTVLSIDIRRMELTDLGRHHHPTRYHSQNSYDQTDRIDTADRMNHQIESLNTVNLKTNGTRSYSNGCKRRSLSKDYLINKSVQFFYFWAKTRMVQRFVMVLSLVWIILIFYKSLLVVELMRHDVNVSKETMDALLPKGAGLPRLIQANFQQYIFSSTKSKMSHSNVHSDSNEDSNSGIGNGFTYLPTLDYVKRNFKSLVTISSNEEKNKKHSVNIIHENLLSTLPQQKSRLFNWQSLDYYHWLSLFANYNVSLYNRYVAILPEITIDRLVSQKDILKYRNENEIKKYDSLLFNFDDEQSMNGSQNLSNQEKQFTTQNMTVQGRLLFRWAVYELAGIVILGIPTIYFIVYLFTLVYKCLCSRKYEQWRKTWSTANIKRQYKKIHARVNVKNCLICDNIDGTYKASKAECQACTYENSSDDSFNEQRNNEEEAASELSSFDSDYESKMKPANSITNLIRKRKKKIRFNDETSDLNGTENGKSFNGSSGSSSKTPKSMDRDALLTKIINGQKDDLELRPVRILNSETDNLNVSSNQKTDRYPIDLVASGCCKLATSDINNQIRVWTLSTGVNSAVDEYNDDETRKFDLKSSDESAVWSLCVTQNDKHLFVGKSNGLLSLFDLTTEDSTESNQSVYEPNRQRQLNPGITQLVELKSNKNNDSYLTKKNHILLKNQTESSSSPSIHSALSYLILISRLNGYIELMNCVPATSPTVSSQFHLVCLIRIFNSPITSLVYEGDYLIATSQESFFKIIKIKPELYLSCNNLSLIFNSNSEQFLDIIIASDSYQHQDSFITAVCIDRDNSVSAATGSKNGTICLWNLSAGKCDLKLNSANSHYSTVCSENRSDQKANAILKIELAENFIISLNEQHQMFIWNRTRGYLIKEFTFLSPTRNRLENSIDSGELTGHSVNSSFVKSLLRTLSLKFSSTSSSFSSYDPSLEIFSFKTVPTMCLYSKQILITGGCSCILLWNISKGELVKKITIRKPFNSMLCRDNSKRFNSQNDYVKEIRIIEKNTFKKEMNSVLFNNKNSFNNNNTNNNNFNSLKNVKKLILITDYTDTFYLLKIPSNLSLDD